MPIGFDPNDTAEVMLDCIDKDKPAEQRAKFESRFLTAGQAKKIERLRKEATTKPSDIDEDALLNEAIRFGIVGWKNLFDHAGKPIPFTDEGLDEFTIAQKYRMSDEYPQRMRTAERERKNSPSPSPSATGSSADTATANPAP